MLSCYMVMPFKSVPMYLEDVQLLDLFCDM